jgi:hypothetical protein
MVLHKDEKNSRPNLLSSTFKSFLFIISREAKIPVAPKATSTVLFTPLSDGLALITIPINPKPTAKALLNPICSCKNILESIITNKGVVKDNVVIKGRGSFIRPKLQGIIAKQNNPPLAACIFIFFVFKEFFLNNKNGSKLIVLKKKRKNNDKSPEEDIDSDTNLKKASFKALIIHTAKDHKAPIK